MVRRGKGVVKRRPTGPIFARPAARVKGREAVTPPHVWRISVSPSPAAR